MPVGQHSQFSWKCFTGMRRQEVELLVLTWLHHVGMGPSEGGKQQANTDACVYFCPLTLEKQFADHNVWMMVYWKKHFFKGATLSLSGCAGSSMIMAFSSAVSLYLSLSFSLCACLRVCASWGQDQAWALKAGSPKLYCPADSWVEQLPFFFLNGDRGVEVERVKYHSLTHSLWLSTTFPFSIFSVHPVSCVCLSNSSYFVSPFAHIAPFLALLAEDRWVNNKARKRDTVSPEASFRRSVIVERYR